MSPRSRPPTSTPASRANPSSIRITSSLRVRPDRPRRAPARTWPGVTSRCDEMIQLASDDAERAAREGTNTNRVILVSRRGFLGGMFSAGALILCARLLPANAAESLQAADLEEAPWYPSVYLGIEPSGTVIIVAHRSEMGTGIRTALPMVAADELDADWTRVRIEQAPFVGQMSKVR